MLADGRARHLHPWLLLLHCVVDGTRYAGDVLAPLLSAHLDLPLLRIADIVEMDAVDVVLVGDLATDVGQIGGRQRVLGVHKGLVADALH